MSTTVDNADAPVATNAEQGRPPLFGHIEIPSTPEITHHNGRVCRIRGWLASTREWPTFVRVTLNDAPPREVAVSLQRPDILETLAEYGVSDDRVGFDFYFELPPQPWKEQPALTVELTDGDITIPESRFTVSPEIEVQQVTLPGGITYPEPVLETYENSSDRKRALAQRWLKGRGLEFGALHQPLVLEDEDTTVQYADRLTKREAVDTYPELATHFDDSMVQPDFIVDLNDGDLSALRDEQFDFFVASDVIEHLANPVQFLKAVHDAMKPGARLLLSVPDSRFTFDAGRHLTSRRHLWREYRRHVTRIDNAHVRRFLKDFDQLEEPWWQRTARLARYDAYRDWALNFHVHVWDNDSFDELLAYACRRVPLHFELLAATRSEESVGAMVYVLERRAAR